MWQRLKSWAGGGDARRGLRFLIHKRYQIDLPFPQYDARRPFRILHYLERRGLLRRGMLVRPGPVSLKRLGLVHDAAYLHSLEDPDALTPILGFRLDAREADRFLCFQRLTCGGTLRAARSALYRRQVMVNLGGGLHHAEADRGSGFCVFNDVAVAIRSLRRQGFDRPILVIDLDLHDGDGTRAIFADDATVHTFSVHNRDLGQANAVADTRLALGSGVEDRQYLEAVRGHLPPVFADFKPGLVFYLAGSDPGVDDKLGDWRITLDGLLARDRLVMELVRPFAGNGPTIPTVILLAGGYGPQAWRHGAALFSWLLSGRSELDIPLEMELPVDHYRRLTRHMTGPRHGQQEPGANPQDGAAGDAGWGLQEDDLPGAGAPRDGLFLGIFSRHGIELALEDFGLLERLRRLGFRALTVAVDLDDPLGHTLRVLDGEDRALVVLEIRLRIQRGAEAAANTLTVEWLLIQDARSSFEISRPLLPGQEYPGLGLLRDIAAVLIVACERLDLDGLAFVPSHFHLACLAQSQGFFPDPQNQARFEALRGAVRGLRLREAALAVDRGLVADAATGRPVAWVPERMVLPVSEAARRRFVDEPYRRAVAQAAQHLRFVLRKEGD